jgi:LmbE family N-acetylglucosaminyl deacetylase
MLRLIPGLPARRPWTMLCLGAHADDIEIGCGGTVLRLLAEHRRVTVHWVVFSAAGRREAEARRSAVRFTRRAAARHLRIERFRDGFLPYEGAAVKEVFEALKETVRPDLVFTHSGDDAHQDHRLVAELTWNTFRRHGILEYEVPKYDGDLGRPNVFVPLPAGIRRRKVRGLMTGFPSQRRKRWFTETTFNGLMRLRGVECGAAEGYAEAFYGRKLVLDPAAGRG